MPRLGNFQGALRAMGHNAKRICRLEETEASTGPQPTFGAVTWTKGVAGASWFVDLWVLFTAFSSHLVISRCQVVISGINVFCFSPCFSCNRGGGRTNGLVRAR
jgi:hypothetical protein